ncbi:rhodanese-like domain-containing protein [Parendozoicomonas sp. Alg238-R29]|uniref:sulfurtransferase n=1 Tax=Parendozoicomonas sp. Alg238-R29 TaxID=2993446 RepID=UPI00248DDCBD|nr:rhodanese-like domain-containing protein [Parendozoicomonas sp. Alg238-R29]
MGLRGFLVMAVVVTGLAGCEKAQAATLVGQKVSLPDTYTHPEYLISAQWLNHHLDDANLIIVDARSEDDYDDEHIPGAVHAAWSQFSFMGDPSDKNHGLLLPDDQLAREISKLGISKNSRVVVYIDPLDGFGEDGRLVWMLNYAGIDDAAILNGGIRAYKNAGFMMSSKSERNDYGSVIIDKDKTIYATTEYVAANLDKLKLLDTREREEYDGKKNYGEVRDGRIPGAVHIFYKDFLDSNGFLKTQSDIESMMIGVGISKGDEIIVYCTGGIRAGLVTVALKTTGYEKVRNYDGSMWNWAADDALAMVK